MPDLEKTCETSPPRAHGLALLHGARRARARHAARCRFQRQPVARRQCTPVKNFKNRATTWIYTAPRKNTLPPLRVTSSGGAAGLAHTRLIPSLAALHCDKKNRIKAARKRRSFPLGTLRTQTRHLTANSDEHRPRDYLRARSSNRRVFWARAKPRHHRPPGIDRA